MQTIFNYGGQVTVTPTASDTPDLNITIEGTAYNTAWDTNVATTIDNWIASHAQNVADRYGIGSFDGATVLNLLGVGDASISASDGNVVASDISFQQGIDLRLIESILPASDTILVCDLSAEATDATLTLLFVSAADRKKGENELGEKLQASGRGTGMSIFQTACSGNIS